MRQSPGNTSRPSEPSSAAVATSDRWAPVPTPVLSTHFDRTFVMALVVSVALHVVALVMLARASHRIEVIEIALVGQPGGGAGPSRDEGSAGGNGVASAMSAAPAEPAATREAAAPRKHAAPAARATVAPPSPSATRRRPEPVARAAPRAPAAASGTPVDVLRPARHASIAAPPTPPAEAVSGEPAASATSAAAGHAATEPAGGGAGGRVVSGQGLAGGAGDGGSGGDLRAACLACPAPDYPRQAERQGWEGSVDLRLRIEAGGRVAEVVVVRASGFRVLDDAAIGAARRSRFHLADVQRRAGPVWGRMRYRFELGG